MESKIIQIKSSKGINNIVTGGGEPIRAKLYKQETMDRESDGEFVADYDDRPFPSSKVLLSPKWDENRKIWPWGGSATKFKEIVGDLHLRYWNGPRKGEMIKVEALEKHQRNYHDPIFHHPDLIGKVSMTGGRGTLNLDIPLEAFIYYQNKAIREVVDETNENLKVNPLMKESASYVMTSPEKANIVKRKNTETQLEAVQVIINNKNNERRLRAYCTIFNIPGISGYSDLNEMVNALTDHVLSYGDKPQRGSGFSSLNAGLIAHDSMDDSELQHRYILRLAKLNGHIRTDKDGFRLLGVQQIHGPSTMDEIYKYFASDDEKAGVQFSKLLDKMKELNQI